MEKRTIEVKNCLIILGWIDWEYRQLIRFPATGEELDQLCKDVALSIQRVGSRVLGMSATDNSATDAQKRER